MSIQYKKIIIVSAVGILVVPAIALSVSYASAHYDQGERAQYRSSIKQAVESGDYDTWQQLTEGKKISQNIDTPQEFEQMKKMHELYRDGQREEADQVREDLGLPHRGSYRENKQAMKDAIATGDYNSWKEAAQDHPKKSELSEEEFDKLVQAYTFKQEGRYDEAKVIYQELGLHGKHPHPHPHK